MTLTLAIIHMLEISSCGICYARHSIHRAISLVLQFSVNVWNTYSGKNDLLLFVRDYSFHGFRQPDRRIVLDNQESHTGDTPSGQFLSASSFFPSKSFRQGAKNICPVAALLTVRAATIIQSNVTATEKIYLSLAQVSSEERQGTSHTVPKTLKKVDGNSLAI